MRRYQGWLVALGLAATPGLIQASPPSIFSGARGQSPAAQAAPPARGGSQGKSNQEMADHVALALRRVQLKGASVDVQFQNGVAILGGTVKTPEQRTRAAEAAARVPGVRSVQNRLAVVDGRKAAPAAERSEAPVARQQPARRPGGIRQVQYEEGAADPNAGYQQQPSGGDQQANQQMAQQIAMALQQAEFVAYDVEILYENGVAVLRGAVASPQQVQAATAIVQQVPGVSQVSNELEVVQGAGQPMPGMQGMPGGPQGMMPAGMMAGGPMPMGGAPGMMGPSTMYDQPNLPDHAWPTYANYPNYSQVTYPSQYSASAWPYIGPFYPYPQIPLGWRKAQLEWDDGYWNLNFNPRTDRWWWFLDARNW